MYGISGNRAVSDRKGVKLKGNWRVEGLDRWIGNKGRKGH
jgi:hypothetical protein